MKHQKTPVVINVNKNGEIFEPSQYLVRREENKQLYQFLEDTLKGRNAI